MKRKIITTILSSIMLCSALFFTACGKNGNSANLLPSENFQSEAQNQSTTADTTHLISGFETYEEVVNMRLINSFGKAQLVSEHVTEGNRALKLTVNGDYATTAHPILAIPTDTNSPDKKDFSDVDKIYLDVYNDNDSPQTIYFSYLLKKSAAYAPSNETAKTIGAKQTETLIFELNRDLMNCFVDLKNVLQIRLSFDCSTYYNQPYRIFYVDNLRYSTTDAPIENVQVREPGEIELCDSADYLMAWSNINKYIYAPSVISFNTDSRFVKQGTGSFRVTNVPNYGVTGTNETYNVGWKINPKVKDMRDYYSYSFWVYNDYDKPLNLRASYHYSTGVNYPTQGAEEFELKAKDWTYIEVTTEHLLANGVNPKNFNWLSVSVWVPRTEHCNFYFDAIYLNTTPSEHK